MQIIPRERRPQFRHAILRIFFNLSQLALRPFLWTTHLLLGPWFMTTVEKQRSMRIWLRWMLTAPLHLTVLIVLSPSALLSFLFKNILHQLQDPFIISFKPLRHTYHYGSDNKSANNFYEKLVTKSAYSAVTANVCLGSGVMSKFNNLPKPKHRARSIAERIFVDQTYYRSMMHNQIKGQTFNHVNSGARMTRSAAKKSQSQNFLSSTGSVITRFPHSDFLCFQETYDRDSVKLLVAELHKVYPWIVYDVGYWSPTVNRCGLNSGLMVASRYEVLRVDFKVFKRKTGVCKFISTGLLMVKVLLEDNLVLSERPNKVGYVFNTHLQPFQGSERIIDAQMTDILEWTSQFRQETLGPMEDVLFDVLCGDFNTDNMSPCDVHQSHHRLFEVYTDVGRLGPGIDHDWTVGTEMRTTKLLEDTVSTPEGLKTVLDDSYLRQQYVLDADLQAVTLDSIYKSSVKTDRHGNVILAPAGGKRRVDFVLYRNDQPLTVESYNFVTRLAPMTDHIPVAMTFSC